MQLLVGSAHNITRLSLDRSSVQHVVNGKIGDIDYDVRRGRLFWINMEESKVHILSCQPRVTVTLYSVYNC